MLLMSMPPRAITPCHADAATISIFVSRATLSRAAAAFRYAIAEAPDASAC